MTEDSVFQMLMEVAAGTVADERDVELAQAAAAWAARNDHWQPHLHNAFTFTRNGMRFLVTAYGAGQVLEIKVRAEGSPMGWQMHTRSRIAHLGHALNVLATEDLIPARFSTLGRSALDDYSEVCERSARRLWEMAHEPGAGEGEEGPGYPWELRLRAATLNMAADRAKAFSRAALQVMT
jgi:hypothetical protein